MKSNSNNALKCYLKKSKRTLHLPKAEKEKYLDYMEQQLLGYIEDAGRELTYSDLVEFFGGPKEVALKYIETAQLQELLRATRRKHIFVWVLVALVALVLIGLGIWELSVLYHSQVRVTQKIIVGILSAF